MLNNSEKMVLISPSPTTNQWPQSQLEDAMGSSGRVMEKPSPHQELLQQQQQKQQEQALKCPRCESTNTKFCYYNNYSLSQPRHFCKACKRYWTRGGTLRNVPAGGGFRRNNNNNKRLIKRSSSDHTTSSSPLFSAPTNPAASSQPQIIASASTSTHVTPMFDCDVNLPFTSRFNYTISSSAGYDILQPRMNALGLGFPSGFDKNGSSNSYYDSSIFGSNYRSSSNNSPVMMPDSLIMNYCGVKDGPADGSNNIVTFEGLAPPQMVASSGGGGVVALKDVKVEAAAAAAAGRQNQMMEHVGLYDPPPPPPNSLYHYNWNNTSSTPMVGIWNDNQPNNIGPPSSLTSSLI